MMQAHQSLSFPNKNSFNPFSRQYFVSAYPLVIKVCTLFDENACCHMAVGQGFGEVLDGYLELSQDELLKRGINDSLIHVDFMVGSDDLHIVGHRADGTTADVFTNGSWADGAGR